MTTPSPPAEISHVVWCLRSYRSQMLGGIAALEWMRNGIDVGPWILARRSWVRSATEVELVLPPPEAGDVFEYGAEWRGGGGGGGGLDA